MDNQDLRDFLASLNGIDHETLRTALHGMLLSAPSDALKLFQLINDEDLVSLLDDEDWTLRVAAALELSNRADPRAADTLVGAFEEGNPETRGVIATAIGAIAGAKEAEFLLSALADGTPSARARVANAIANLARREDPSSPVSQVLQRGQGILLPQALNDENAEARRYAAIALVSIHEQRALAMLLELLRNQDTTLQIAALQALVSIRTHAGQEARQQIQDGLLQALGNEEALVRLNAIEALAPVRAYDVEVISALIPLYRRDIDRRVRDTAGAALGNQRPLALREQPSFKMISVLSVAALSIALFLVIGRLVYQPVSPLPAEASTLPSDGIYGTNERVMLLLQSSLSSVQEQRDSIRSLEPSRNGAFRISCPRQIEDLLFGKKNCETLILAARTPDASLNLRFLLFRERGQIRSIAIEAPTTSARSPDGDFVELLDTVEREHKVIIDELRVQVTEILGKVRSKDWVEYPADGKGVYLPLVSHPYYQAMVEDLRQSNPALRHLLLAAPKANSQLSLGARVFTIRKADASGMYRPGFKLVQRPVFPEPQFVRTIAHELTHAALDGSEGGKLLLAITLPYLKSTHPTLIEDVLTDFYGEAVSGPGGDLRKAEESIAFFAGSVANEETRVTFLKKFRPFVTGPTDFKFVTEPLFSSDVELLVLLGLLPNWMSPVEVGHTEQEITRGYYKKVKRAFAERN